MISQEAAMACTVAVESVIGEHYNRSVVINIREVKHTNVYVNVYVC